MDTHDRVVASIAASVKQFYARQEAFRIYHGSTNSTRQSQYKRDRMIDTSRLINVLSVNTETKTALVEPNVPMDALVEVTIQYGLVPPVIMEFPYVLFLVATTQLDLSSHFQGLYIALFASVEELANQVLGTAPPVTCV